MTITLAGWPTELNKLNDAATAIVIKIAWGEIFKSTAVFSAIGAIKTTTTELHIIYDTILVTK